VVFNACRFTNYKQSLTQNSFADTIVSFEFLKEASLLIMPNHQPQTTNHQLPSRYFIINKPFNMVSQFVSTHDVRLLGDIDFNFPEGIHAVGRLDNDSEGLLILTTNKKITRLLFLSDEPHKRTYLVQINNILSAENLKRLQNGISIRIKTGVTYTTAPCDVSVVTNPGELYDLGERLTAYHPFTWLLITITEGKFHQVRKMIAATGHKCKRLIRVSIEDLELDGLKAGEVMELEEKDFFKKLNLEAVTPSLRL
jgi:23S rRNA pseudouridine2457 synthase